MSGVIAFLHQAAASPISGFILAVLAISLDIHLYRKARQRVRLQFAVPDHSRSIDSISEASIRSPGAVARLVGANVAIWNSGTHAIRAGDVAPRDPLCLRTCGHSPIVYFKLADVIRDANGIRVDRVPDDPSALSLIFDYMDPGDGATISVFYEGPEDEGICVMGSVMQGGSPERRQDREIVGSILLIATLFFIGWAVFFIGVGAYGHSRLAGFTSIFVGLVFYPVSLFLASRIRQQQGIPPALRGYVLPPKILPAVMERSYEHSVFAAMERIARRSSERSN